MRRVLVLTTALTASALRPLALELPRGGNKKHAEKASTLAHAGAAVFAAAELSEGVLEIGHHHGLALVAVSKLARGLQQVEIGFPGRKRLLKSRITLPLVCLAAIGTSAWEVYKDARLDAKVGGHHGMLILALYALQEAIEETAGTTRRGYITQPVVTYWLIPRRRGGAGLVRENYSFPPSEVGARGGRVGGSRSRAFRRLEARRPPRRSHPRARARRQDLRVHLGGEVSSLKIL